LLEEQLQMIWKDWEDILFFETNAFCHFDMIVKDEYSELFEINYIQIKKTFELIKANLVLALTSNEPYLRLFAELISKTL